MMCPLSLGMFVYPVEIKGKLFELSAIQGYVRSKHGNAPNPFNSTEMITTRDVEYAECSYEMYNLVKKFKADFHGIRVVYTY